MGKDFLARLIVLMVIVMETAPGDDNFLSFNPVNQAIFVGNPPAPVS